MKRTKKWGEKDLSFRLKIARKEAKESKYWIHLLQELNPELKETSEKLLFEVEELRRILSAIITKINSNK